MIVYTKTNDLSKAITVLRDNGFEVGFASDLMSAALDDILKEKMGENYDECLANDIIDELLGSDLFQNNIPNIVDELVDVELEAEKLYDEKYPEEEFIDYVVGTTDIQFWNWKKRRFDEPHTGFDYTTHVNDSYHKKDQVEYINDTILCGNGHYLATIVDGDSSNNPLIFSPGNHIVNRQGYVVYKADAPLEKDYWI